MKMSHIVIWMALFFGSIGLANAAQDEGSCDEECMKMYREMLQSQFEEC